MHRRQFLESIATLTVTGAVAGGVAGGVTPTLFARGAQGQAQGNAAAANEWGTKVFDLHFHMRPQPASNLAHLDGAGITKANLLTRGAIAEPLQALMAAAPGRFTWFHASDVAQPDAEQVLTKAVKDGAQGFGEMKFHVAADGPELRRAYALAAELKVPILVHFQEVDHFPNEGTWSTGYARTFESILKAYPKTTFIGHADAFWANVSADYRNQAAYPSGPIVRGGVTDKWLGDYANLFGDLSANSGNNAMSRDATFTADFFKRHQDKLLFGSDCTCSDGHGAGVSQNNNPAATRMTGKCVARETLTVLKQSAAPDVFAKIAWGNAHKLLRIPA
jgi:predicted TIM-barrel fold metal-dependent hydrolase